MVHTKKGWFIPFQNIDEIMTAQSMEKPHEMGVTVFYFDHKNKDKEVTFFFVLN